MTTAATGVPAHDKALLSAFPEPPAEVRELLEVMETILRGDADAITELGDVKGLCPPWLPSGCPPEIRQQMWLWCDDVAGWINRHYVWRPTAMIPACWPRHPHIAQELPVLTCLHFDALNSTSPVLLEDWHRQTLPQFLERLASRLGESTCRTGTHDSWPAAARYKTFTGPTAVQERHELFHTDAHPPTPLRGAHRVRA